MSTPQQTVTREADTITIQPAEADTVYLPEYDPWLVYGAPVAVYLGWSDASGLYLTEPDVLFGLGIGIGAVAAFGWGYHHWGTDWHGRNVVYNHNTYVSHSRAFPSHDASYGAHTSFAHSGGFNGGTWNGQVGMRYGTYNGFNRGVARTFAFHAAPAFRGGFRVGGFHGDGGFHGGGSLHGGGGHR